MNIYMFAEHEEIHDVRELLAAQLSKWAQQKTTVQFVDRDTDSSELPKTQRAVEVGIELSVSKDRKLKEPLNALFKFSKTFKCDFVVGVIEDEQYQDVCYFGDQEGRPDMYEIANYLGLSE